MQMGTMVSDRLAERLQEFAYKVGRLWSQRSLVTDLTSEFMGSEKFRDELWVVCFVGVELPKATEVAESMRAFVPSKAKELLDMGVRVGFVECNADDQEDSEALCEEEGVDHSQIRLYGEGKGPRAGRALLTEPFGDTRDVEVAMEVMVATLRVLIGNDDDSTAVS